MTTVHLAANLCAHAVISSLAFVPIDGGCDKQGCLVCEKGLGPRASFRLAGVRWAQRRLASGSRRPRLRAMRRVLARGRVASATVLVL